MKLFLPLALRAFVLALALCSAAPTVQAQLATLVADPPSFQIGGANNSSDPNSFLQLGEKAIFRAHHQLLGSRLWVTDGTAAGTQLLADTCPECAHFEVPVPLVSSGRLAYFLRRNFGGEVWRSDGTEQGTFALDPSGALFYRDGAALLGDRLLFFAGTPTLGIELWTSTGTPASTRLVREIVPGPGSAVPTDVGVLGSEMIFLVLVGENLQLWATDGSEAGTRKIVDLPGFSSTFTLDTPVVSNGRLFFMVREPATRRRALWTTDGTSAGTRQLLRSRHPLPSRNSQLAAFGDRVFLAFEAGTGGQEMWSSDGTLSGTLEISQLSNPEAFSPSRPRQFARLGSRLVFFARSDQGEVELLVTDVDRIRVRTLKTAAASTCSTDLQPEMALARGLVVFEVCQGDSTELWATDGSSEGTLLLRGALGEEYSGLQRVAGAAEELYFTARSPDGVEIFVTDGSVVGTRQKTRFPNSDATGSMFADLETNALVLNGRLLFSAQDSPERGYELWSVASTPDTTSLVADIGPEKRSSNPTSVVESASGRIFLTEFLSGPGSVWGIDEPGLEAEPRFTLRDAGCRELAPARLINSGTRAFLLCEKPDQRRQVLSTDGTLAGTEFLFEAAWVSPESVQAVELGGFSYIAAQELWRTDGTPGGSERILTAILPDGTLVNDIGRVGNRVVFQASGSPARVFATDGTEQGTVLLTTLSGSVRNFVPVADRLLFVSSGSTNAPIEVWATDGTLAGTQLLLDLRSLGVAQLLPAPIESSLGDSLLFHTRIGSGPIQLWKTDGTSEGTLVLHSAASGTDSFAQSANPTTLADAAYFVSWSQEHGQELWRTDGSVAGTTMVRDLLPGARSSIPTDLVAAAGRVFFAAVHPTLGRELWVTDGTSEGTRLLHDVAPGPLSSSPQDLSVVGDRLYFTADDGIHGRELWSLNLDDTGCVPNDHALCLQDGRFRVEADWKDFQGNEGRGTAVSITPDTGYFWFFQPSNIEAVLKVLDGRGLNDHFWTFYGALSTVEYNLTITDAETGVSRRYYNPPGNLASRADTASFGPNGASLERYTPPAEQTSELAEVFRTNSLDFLSPRGTCAPASNRLCLRNGRFAIEATWRDFQGNAGTGTAVPITGDTGTFWFFRPENLEVILKVLDGTGLNGRHWVFYGALSSVEYTLTVTDTSTGAVKTYFNPLGRLASVADTGAF